MKSTSGTYGWYFSGKHPIAGTSASISILDALCCAKGPICHRVFVQAPLVHMHRRVSGSSRRTIWRIDCTEILPIFVSRMYYLAGISEIKKKSDDLCMNTWLCAIEASGRTGWLRISDLLQELVLEELDKKKRAK